ncbi:hypothetical protein [Paenibacillus aestuarii]|uniref:Uncharacterized protein n=1 Tax=Paenibacillus aestuarii TaxID=516965 RepID=A0ABW0KA10_9BACL|nr:hypothetical protein [Paenibacillus aestuarii]
MLDRIIQTKGKPYGWGEVIALLLRKRFGCPIYWDDPDAFECAEELVTAVYAETGIRIVDQSTGDVCPQDLWESAWLEDVKELPNH